MQKGRMMGEIDAFYYVLERCQTQMKLYQQSNDDRYLDAITDYLRVANIYINHIKETNHGKVCVNS